MAHMGWLQSCGSATGGLWDFGLYWEVVSGDNVGVKKALGYLAPACGNCMR